MSTELERRLEELLGAAPEPEAGAGEEALHRALRALRPAPPARRGLRTAALAFAATLVLLAIAAGSLAAAGALHVSFGPKAKARPAATQLSVPEGADGIAAVVDGRLSVVTRGGFRLQGLRVSAAALSPHALYVAAGISRSLVAMAPEGRLAWSHRVRGTVVAIAWAPDGLRIGYVVHAGGRFVLHVIWGNGTHDAVVDRTVRPVRPSWRADSLAFAYVGAGGKAIVYDLAHQSRRVVAAAPMGGVTQLAFSPTGAQLAVAGRRGFAVEDRPGRSFSKRTLVVGIGWLGDEPVAVGSGGHAILRIDPQSNAIAPKRLVGRAIGFQSNGYRFVVALRSKGSVRVLAGTWSSYRLVLGLPPGTAVRNLQIG